MKFRKVRNLENKDNIKADEPILTIQKTKSTKSNLYGIFFTILLLFIFLICVAFLNINNIIPNLIGGVLIIFIPYWFVITLKLEKIFCYDDFLIAKYTFFSKKVYYKDIKYYWNKRTIITNDISIAHKKFWNTIFVSKYLFDNAILDDLKNFLNSKNIKQWSLFNKI